MKTKEQSAGGGEGPDGSHEHLGQGDHERVRNRTGPAEAVKMFLGGSNPLEQCGHVRPSLCHKLPRLQPIRADLVLPREMGHAHQMPSILVYNRQRRVKIPLPWLRHAATTALPRCIPHSRDGRGSLAQISEVEVSVVSDRTIAQVHLDFLGIPGPTDVITFEHGELVVSADTAQSNALEHGTSLEAELLLYIIHGMLHLNGFTDEQRAEARRMHRVQDRILGECLLAAPPSNFPKT